MTQIKQLKEKTNYNLVDFFGGFLDKTKYIDLGIKLFKNYLYQSSYFDNTYSEIINNHPELFKDKSIFEQYFSISVLLTLNELNGVSILKKFEELNEKNLITQNDLSKYTNFNELVQQINIGELKLIEKKLMNERIVVYEDNEWLFIKPLTFASSLKYGSNTRWCTAYTKDPNYFYEKIIDGILIYCINKIKGEKIAIYKSVNINNELQFWDDIDNRLDSMQTPFNNDVLKFVKEHCLIKNPTTNFDLTTDKYVEEELEYLKNNNLHSSSLLEKLEKSPSLFDYGSFEHPYYDNVRPLYTISHNNRDIPTVTLTGNNQISEPF